MEIGSSEKEKIIGQLLMLLSLGWGRDYAGGRCMGEKRKKKVKKQQLLQICNCHELDSVGMRQHCSQRRSLLHQTKTNSKEMYRN